MVSKHGVRCGKIYENIWTVRFKCTSNIIIINLLWTLNLITKHGSWIALGISMSSDKPPDIGEITHKYHLNFNGNHNLGEVNHKYPFCNFAENLETHVCPEDLRQENAILYKLLYTAIAKAENAEKSLNQVLQENKFLKMVADAAKSNKQKSCCKIRMKTDTKAQYAGCKSYEAASPGSMKSNIKPTKNYRSYATVCGDKYKEATKLENDKISSERQNEEYRTCKYCGGMHKRGSEFCPAYGKTCK